MNTSPLLPLNTRKSEIVANPGLKRWSILNLSRKVTVIVVLQEFIQLKQLMHVSRHYYWSDRTRILRLLFSNKRAWDSAEPLKQWARIDGSNTLYQLSCFSSRSFAWRLKPSESWRSMLFGRLQCAFWRSVAMHNISFQSCFNVPPLHSLTPQHKKYCVFSTFAVVFLVFVVLAVAIVLPFSF